MSDFGFGEELIEANKHKDKRQALGDIMEPRLVKQVIDMTKCRETGQIFYLCSWHQDKEDSGSGTHYRPSWVKSQILNSILKEHT